VTARRWQDWALLATLVVVWGSSFAATKIGVETISPTWMVALRMAVAALVLVPLAFLRGPGLPKPSAQWGWLVLLTLLGYLAPFWLISWGTQYIASGLSGILMAMVPLAVIMLAHFFLPDEPLTKLKLAGFATGFAGVIVLLGPDKLANLAAQGIAFWAQIAVLGATLCYAVHGVVARRMPLALPSTVLAASVTLLGGAAMVAFAAISEPDGLVKASTASLAAAVTLGLFPTALATIILYVILRTAGASFLSMCNYLIPGFAVILGAIALGERISLGAMTGLVLILGGIAISEGRWKPNK